jgi:hypothetical protein
LPHQPIHCDQRSIIISGYGINDSDNEDVFLKIESYFDIKINRNVEIGAIKSKKIWNRLYLHFDSRFEWPSFSLPYQGTRGRCHRTINHIGIHADGTVVPCCLDKNGAIWNFLFNCHFFATINRYVLFCS